MEFAPLEVSSAPPPSPKSAGLLNATAQETLTRFKAGESIPEIAATRGLSESTIEGHLAQAIELGETIDPRQLYTAQEELEMRKAMDGYHEIALKPVFEQLGGKISYGKLKLYRVLSEIAR